MSYLNLITFHSNHSLDKDRVLLPKVLFFLKSASSRVENNNITSFWIPGSQQDVLLTFDLEYGRHCALYSPDESVGQLLAHNVIVYFK